MSEKEIEKELRSYLNAGDAEGARILIESTGFKDKWWRYSLGGELSVISLMQRSSNLKMLKMCITDMDEYRCVWKEKHSIVKLAAICCSGNTEFEPWLKNVLYWVEMGVKDWDDTNDLFLGLVKYAQMVGFKSYTESSEIRKGLEHLGVDVWVSEGKAVNALFSSLKNEVLLKDFFETIPNKTLLLQNLVTYKLLEKRPDEFIKYIIEKDLTAKVDIALFERVLLKFGKFKPLHDLRGAMGISKTKEEIVKEVEVFCGKILNKTSNGFYTWLRSAHGYEFTTEDKAKWFKAMLREKKIGACNKFAKSFDLPLSYKDPLSGLAIGFSSASECGTSFWKILDLQIREKAFDWISASGGFTREFVEQHVLEHMINRYDADSMMANRLFDELERQKVQLNLNDGINGMDSDDFFRSFEKSFLHVNHVQEWKSRIETHYLKTIFSKSEKQKRAAL